MEEKKTATFFTIKSLDLAPAKCILLRNNSAIHRNLHIVADELFCAIKFFFAHYLVQNRSSFFLSYFFTTSFDGNNPLFCPILNRLLFFSFFVDSLAICRSHCLLFISFFSYSFLLVFKAFKMYHSLRAIRSPPRTPPNKVS